MVHTSVTCSVPGTNCVSRGSKPLRIRSGPCRVKDHRDIATSLAGTVRMNKGIANGQRPCSGCPISQADMLTPPLCFVGMLGKGRAGGAPARSPPETCAGGRQNRPPLPDGLTKGPNPRRCSGLRLVCPSAKVLRQPLRSSLRALPIAWAVLAFRWRRTLVFETLVAPRSPKPPAETHALSLAKPMHSSSALLARLPWARASLLLCRPACQNPVERRPGPQVRNLRELCGFRFV